VAERTNYEIDFTEVYATVVKPGEELSATGSGIIDICACISVFEPRKLMLQNYSSWVPFSSTDPIVVQKAAARTAKEWPILADMFEEKYNTKALVPDYPLPAAASELLVKFPVTSIADLKGKKIAQSGPYIPLMEKSGIVGVQASITEAYTSIQTGVYDGYCTNIETWYFFNVYKVAPYYCITGAFGCPIAGYIIMNLDTYNSLPQEVRDIIKESYEEYGREWVSGVVQRNEQLLKKACDEGGVTVAELPPADRLKWAEASKYMARDKAEEIDAEGLPGTGVIRNFINNLKAEGHVFLVEPVFD